MIIYRIKSKNAKAFLGGRSPQNPEKNSNFFQDFAIFL